MITRQHHSSRSKHRLFPAVAVLTLSVFVCVTQAGANEANAAERFQRGAEHYRAGNFGAAIAVWQQVSDGENPALVARAHLAIAEAALKSGHYALARRHLEQVHHADGEFAAHYHALLGNYYLLMQQGELATQHLLHALERSTQHPDLQAKIGNDYGNALVLQGYHADARLAYDNSFALSRDHATDFSIKPLINLLKLDLLEQRGDTGDRLQRAIALVDEFDARGIALQDLIALSELAQQYLSRFQNEAAIATAGRAWLERALELAEAQGNHRSLSHANGLLARYALKQEQDSTQALARTRRALLFAHQASATDIEFQWQRQLGEIHRLRGDLAQARDAYARAIESLAPVREELLSGYRHAEQFFTRNIRPVYIEFIDLLLQQAQSTDGSEQTRHLRRAIDTLEQLKSAEYQDYFRDQCVVMQERQAVTVETLAAGAAVLYPVILPDRLELLLSVNGQVRRHTVAVDSDTLEANAEAFRRLVQTQDNRRFLPYANRLHRWIVAPLETQLRAAGVDTLVVVPDGVLRTIPLAALHDGRSYLVEQFALAITPSITLTAPRRLALDQSDALLAGVSQPVQGFASLAHVPAELEAVRRQIGGTVLADSGYTVSALAEHLRSKPYSVVHLATHGVVGNSAQSSYLLAHDARLSIDVLSELLQAGRFRDRPVELLTLSACSTAIGDERAALGFAGLALKSGARSALASLWLIDDEATGALMARFYVELNNANLYKAQALRRAQLSMLDRPEYRHPAHWAAFLMIGNWL